MKKVLAGILIAALTVQISMGTVFAEGITDTSQVQSGTGGAASQADLTEADGENTDASAPAAPSQETPNTGLPRIAIPVPKGQESAKPTEIIRGDGTQTEESADPEADTEADEADYPDWWDPDDPMNAKVYEQMNGYEIRTMAGAYPPSGPTTYWPTREGDSKFIHNDYNLANRNLLVGIDVSYHQGSINWTKVKNDGVEFVILRAGYSAAGDGSLHEDKNFDVYIKGAKAAGLKVGVYFFSQALTTGEAEKEAQKTLDIIKGNSLDMPVFFDYEDYANGRLTKKNLSKSAKTANALAFCSKIEQSGYPAMVYASASWFGSELDTDQIKTHGIWMARYNNYLHGTDGKYYGRPVDLWQCTSHAVVNGISTNVDLDFWYTSSSTVTYSATRSSPNIWQGTRSANMVRVDWDWVRGATGYEVAYSEKRKSGYKTVTVEGETATNREITGLADGREYYVKVRTFVRDDQGRVTYSPYSAVTAMTTSQSVGIRFKTTSNVHIRQYAGTEYKSLGVVSKGKGLVVQAIAKDESGAAWYKTSVTLSGKSVTGFIKTSNTSEYVGTVSGVGKSGSETTAITVKWTKLPEAQGYQVYRATSKNGSYKNVKTISGGSTTSWRDTGKSSGKTYYYKVRAYKKINGKTTYGSFSSQTGLATAKAASSSSASSSSTGKKVKTTSNVNLRKKAGTSYGVLKTIPKGKTLTVLGTSKDKKKVTWYKVKYTVGKKSYTGYISSKYAKATSTSSSSSSKSSSSSTVAKGKKIKTTANVNLRKKAGTSYGVLKTVPKGKTFTVLGTSKDKKKVTWYKIKYTVKKKSYTGYISSQYAKKA